MKIIFFGTPDFVLPILNSLNKKYNWTNHKELVAVVTQPPKEAGRGFTKTYSPVDKFAHTHKLSIFYDFKDLPDFDLGIVASYGKIIPSEIIKKAKFGILNIHPSLLPKYRGASPIQYAIKNGESETGVTIIKMDEKMDHGPIISQFKEEIKETDTNEILRDRLFERSAEFLINLIPNYLSGKIKLTAQDESKVTLTKLITKKDGFIDPKLLKDSSLITHSSYLHNLIRAMSPWPGIWTYVTVGEGQNLRSSGHEVSKKSQIRPSILKILKAHLENEKLVLDEVQLEGKNKVTWKQFTEGHPNYKLA